MIEKFAQETVDTIKSRYGFTFPWEMIIEMILELIQNCPEPETFVKEAKHPSILQRLALNIRVRRTTGIVNRARVVAISQTLLEQAAAKPENELRAGYYQGQAVFGRASKKKNFKETALRNCRKAFCCANLPLDKKISS